MRRPLLLFVLAASLIPMACSKKEEKKGKVSAALMKPPTVSASLNLDSAGASLADGVGSTVQSFTPDSLKLSIFRVSICRDNSDCVSLYNCAANTVEGCAVELSKIDAFVDSLNAAGAEIEEGKTFDHIGVEFCPEGDRNGIQHLSVNGTVSILGTTYATDPTEGLVVGSTGKDVAIEVQGGCASYYPLTPEFTVSKDNPTQVKMFFDSSLYLYAGISGGASNTNSYPDGGQSCVGTASAYVCAPVTTIVSTIDSGNPTTEHYLISDISPDTGGSEDSTPTASVALYFSSAGVPIGGVQNPYRQSGATVSWGLGLQGGLGLYPKVVSDDTVSFGEPEGSISLANWFKNFQRASHTGTYTYSTYGGGSADGTYKATKF